VDITAGRRGFYKMFARVHGQLLLRTKGRPEHLTPRLRCLVLETTGRHSHQPRRVPLLYMPDGDGFVVLASNFGREHPPAWWLNLQATPDAAVELGGRRIVVRARELGGQERTSMLARAAAHNKQWRTYSTSLRRTLPVVRLERRAP
jgi:deazaflavin-dependent oxidoreductase (nitroreductase family)